MHCGCHSSVEPLPCAAPLLPQSLGLGFPSTATRSVDHTLSAVPGGRRCAKPLTPSKWQQG
jgi:hypothetical protein